jgi:orotate phosphoribosyltransferase
LNQLKVSVSRGISAAADIPAAAAALRDEINALRHTSSSKMTENPGALLDFQRDFIAFASTNNVLQFGSFKLKSGRTSPYFFNAGLFCSGIAMRSLGRFYAKALKEAALDFDVIFGPAYKGIPLATAIGIAWYDLFGENKDVTFNRKEAKDHGEGGNLVGAVVRDRRVVIVDDVITAGTAIRESLELLSAAGANVCGVVVSLDRQEMVSESLRESAIQQVEKSSGISVVSIVRLKHLVSYMEEGSDPEQLAAIRQYRETYGVEY